MKIYVITKGFYDDYEILAVTTDKDMADKYKEAVDDGRDDYLEFCKEIGKNSQMSGGCNDNH